MPKDIKKRGFGEVKNLQDTTKDILEKVVLWLEAGVTLVWLVSPEKETITAYTSDEMRAFSKSDVMTGEPVLSGFKVDVKKFFE